MSIGKEMLQLYNNTENTVLDYNHCKPGFATGLYFFALK